MTAVIGRAGRGIEPDDDERVGLEAPRLAAGRPRLAQHGDRDRLGEDEQRARGRDDCSTACE